MSIRSKLLLAFVSAIILPLGIIAVIVINQARDQALSNFQDLTNREVIQIDRGLSSFFAEVVKDVDFSPHTPKCWQQPRMSLCIKTVTPAANSMR